MLNNIIWFLKIAFCLYLLPLISLLFGCIGSDMGPTIEFVAFPLEGCWKGIESRDLKLTPATRTILSVIWYLLLFGIFLVIPLHHKKYFEQEKFYSAYKKFWLAGSLAIATLWFTLAELGGMPVVAFFPPKPADFLPVYLVEPAIHVVVITFTVWYLAVTPATKQYKNWGN
ncbi:hypothetical protein [Methyloglobulus sp.]|uniref:hypothetical protein n=1 Tax=Methyloglobulus sp. TaxID=2518622 RepID=UPI0032B7D565